MAVSYALYNTPGTYNQNVFAHDVIDLGTGINQTISVVGMDVFIDTTAAGPGDILNVNADGTKVSTLVGDNTINFRTSNDLLITGNGNNSVNIAGATVNNDLVVLGLGRQGSASPSNQVNINSGAGTRNTVISSDANDVINDAGAGNDVFVLGAGTDSLLLGTGYEYVKAGTGTDYVMTPTASWHQGLYDQILNFQTQGTTGGATFIGLPTGAAGNTQFYDYNGGTLIAATVGVATGYEFVAGAVAATVKAQTFFAN